MVCPKCNSNNVTVQTNNQIYLKNVHHSIWWWIFVGSWWIPIKWLIFTVPALLVKLFSHKKQKAINKIVSYAVCQDCGNTWKV